MSFRFRRAFYKLLPSWLSTDEGELVHYSLGVVMDAFLERLRLGRDARFPDTAPPDALPYLARDRKIVRGIDEAQPSYATRLKRWLTDHRTRGNPYALMDQLAAYCNAAVVIRTVDRAGNFFTRAADGSRSADLATGLWNWDGAAATLWSRFWVIIYPTAAGLPWGPSVGDAGGASWPVGGTIGTTATPEQVATVRAIIRDWKPAGTTCEWIIIAFDAASFDPTAPEPDGGWKYFGKPSAGDHVPARLATARYWRGVQGT